MTPVEVRKYCLGMPRVTEQVQWGDNLVFKIGGKIFAIAALEPAKYWLSFKCSPEEYAELVERPGIAPAPYLARASWVALESEDAMSDREVRTRLGRAYELVLEKLPRKVKIQLGLSPA